MSSSELPFQCPVCRAKQSLDDTCRRCKADLRLVVQVRRRIDFLGEQIAIAASRGDAVKVVALKAELLWLTGTKDE